MKDRKTSMRTHGLPHGHQEVSPNVQPNQVEERAMIGPDPTKDPLLAKVVNRMTCDTFLREDLMHQIVRGVFHHLDFFPDYLRFLGDVVGPEERVYDEVRQHFESARQVLIENLG